MTIDFQKFFAACDPSRTLVIANPDDSPYYIDFASVRGGKTIETIKRTITRLSPDKPTCQLFSGHIGCGKSTELLRLKAELEREGFFVVYFESSEDLDMADVDVSDILLAITRQVSEHLEAIAIKLKPEYFQTLFDELSQELQIPEAVPADSDLSVGIATITTQTRESQRLRSQLRQYLEPRTSGILHCINENFLQPATEQLKKQGKNGLVAIVDNLDRVDNRPMQSGRTQPEYLFVDRGEQLRKLNCHLVYTIPLVLIFSNECPALTTRLGGGVNPNVLPMVPVCSRDRDKDCLQGMALLKQLVLARAFPDVEPEQRLGLVTQLFEDGATLDRLCRIGGGHVRNLLGLLYRCLQEEDPPLTRSTLERVIQEERDRLLLAIDCQWDLLFQVVEQQKVTGETEYQALLRSMLVFEYRDSQGRWFGMNPVLAETEKFKSWQQQRK